MNKPLKFLVSFFARFLLFSAICLSVILLIFSLADIGVPRWLLDGIESRLSNDGIAISIERAQFRLTSGIDAGGITIRPLSSTNEQAVACIGSLHADVRWLDLLFDRMNAIDSLVLKDVRYDRLPDSYYAYVPPTGVTPPPIGNFNLDIPDVREFSITAEDVHVLGIEARRVDVRSVRIGKAGIDADGIGIAWYDGGSADPLDGNFHFNADTKVISASVKGLALPSHIRGLMTALDLPSVYPYYDAFTGVNRMLPADYRMEVDILNRYFHFTLDLAPTDGAYNGVGFKSVVGRLEVGTRPGAYGNDVFVKVNGPLDAIMADGGRLKGSLTVASTNDVTTIAFDDVVCSESFADDLRIADLFQGGELDFIVPTHSPYIRISGLVSPDPKNCATNGLTGKVGFARGTISGCAFADVTADIRYENRDFTLENMRASFLHKGTISGSCTVTVNGDDADGCNIRLKVDGKDILPEDLKGSFGFDLGENRPVSGTCLDLNIASSRGGKVRADGKGEMRCGDLQVRSSLNFDGKELNFKDCRVDLRSGGNITGDVSVVFAKDGACPLKLRAFGKAMSFADLKDLFGCEAEDFEDKFDLTTSLSGSVGKEGGAHLEGNLVLDGHKIDANSWMKLDDDKLSFENAGVMFPNGGNLTGDCVVRMGDSNSFDVRLSGRKIPFDDLVEVFGLDIGDRQGSIDINGTISGNTGGDLLRSLKGRGSIKGESANLSKIKVFFGLTDFLAKHVPGIAAFVTQSHLSCDFTCDNGMLHTQNLTIEGDVFSIQGAGTYDFVNDNLDMEIKLSLFPNNTVRAKLLKPLTWLMQKAFFQFKVTGRYSEPKWSSDSVITQIL